jgi:mannose PTS system EIIA component
MIRAIILTHGGFGRVLMEAAESVLGPQEAVDVLSNDGQSLEQMVAALETRLDAEPVVIFVDFCGGSPFIACRTLLDLHPGCAVLSGVNLPMLFSFFTKRAALPFSELVKVVETDAHRGIQRTSP